MGPHGTVRRLSARAAWAAWALALPLTSLAGLPGTPVEQWRFRPYYEGLQTPAGLSTSPIVLQFSDDNGDGRIDADDSPDVAIMAVPSGGGENCVVYVVDGATRVEHARFSGPFRPWDGELQSLLAAADIDADGVAEILVTDRTHVNAYGPGGELERRIPWTGFARLKGRQLATADFNQDGVPEIYSRADVVSADGSWGWAGTELSSAGPGNTCYSAAAEIDPSSPGLELWSGTKLYSAVGSVLWSTTLDTGAFGTVGDLDGDGNPELISSQDGRVRVFTADGRQPVPHFGPPGISVRSSPGPCVSDLDGDGRQEIIQPSYVLLTALGWSELGWEVRWQVPTSDLSGDSLASAYDFDGDGAQEVLYRDELGWYVIDGACGEVLHFEPQPSITAAEMPFVANVDSDPHAEIVVLGIQALGSDDHCVAVYEVPGSCTPRPIFNQPTFHGTNVDDLGRVPAVETPPWTVRASWPGQSIAGVEPLRGLATVNARWAMVSCVPAVLLTWDAATSPDGSPVTYDVYRIAEPAPGACCSTESATLVATNLSEDVHVDPVAPDGTTYAYVIVASAGDACATRHACSPHVVAGTQPPRPAPAGPVLRVRHLGDEVIAHWPGARPLELGEHFHLLKALDSPTSPFALTSPEGLTALEHRETDMSSPLQYFDLRIADACEVSSDD